MPGMIAPGFTSGRCPLVLGLACPASPCPGVMDSGVCKHLASLASWRALGPEEQAARLSITTPAIDPAIRDAVNACPSRGPVLPLSMQDDCGCRGRERSACTAGKGEVPGRVTLRDCLACKGATHQR